MKNENVKWRTSFNKFGNRMTLFCKRCGDSCLVSSFREFDLSFVKHYWVHLDSNYFSKKHFNCGK